MKRLLIKCILGFFTKRIIAKYHPLIIAVTGSVGKTSTKNAIAQALASRVTLRKSQRNLNSDIGVPLVFISGEDAKRSIAGWLRNIMRAFFLIVKKSVLYPRVLVVEMGADRPGDIAYLTGIAKPDIAVVTAIGDVPVHVGYYKDSDAVVLEKANVVRCLGKNDLAILNCDDEHVFRMRAMTQARICTFGFSNQADVRIVDFQTKTERDALGNEFPLGISFKLGYGGSFVLVSILGTLGKPVAYAFAAAAACAASFDMHMIEIVEALSDFENEPGRMRLIPGVHHTMILDDTYNAAPTAMRVALDTFAACSGKRKIAILGDMLELGSYAQKAHEDMGAYAASIGTLLIFVGEQSRFGYEQALRNGFPADRLFHFSISTEVIDMIRIMLQPGDVVLIKGSQGMRMEKIVKGIMAEPEKAGELLVRQSPEWK